MEGKVALITGAARGLGRAFAEILLEKGAKVCICDVNKNLGTQTVKELQNKYTRDRVHFTKCDVTSEKEIENTLKETVAKFGGIDILCNNAGIGDERNWKLMLDINLTAMIHGTLLGCRYMGNAAGRPGGVIINVSSAAGVLPMPFGPVYSASKYGVVGLSRSLGLISPKTYGVRINCLCPSFTNTAILELKEDSVLSSPKVNTQAFLKAADKMVNMVGVMQPREVAEYFLKLVEDDKLTGQVMLVTPHAKEILSLPITIPGVFETHNPKL